MADAPFAMPEDDDEHVDTAIPVEEPDEAAQEAGIAAVTQPEKTLKELAQEVLNGEWGRGSGQQRRENLAAAGHDPNAVQEAVKDLLNGR